ncbi:hypothetical protein JTB14_013022 [Gonioctena quinquepunctata]|nr:hypothetical protein JTB14_013022 [Gonioctena quinquepunctata]
MLQEDIIRPSASPFSAPVVLVEKEAQRCDQIILFPYPEQSRNSRLLRWRRNILYSGSEQRQIEVEPKDREKTAFSVPWGHNECNRMPFGLVNYPATWMRFMYAVLAGLTGSHCFVFFDDIFCFLKRNVHEQVAKLRIRGAGLTLNPDKLYRKSEDFRHGDLPVAPSALLPEIMETYHDLLISGHTGYDETNARMKKMFIWPIMSKDMKKYVDASISCPKKKISLHAKPAPLERFEIASKPFYRIAIDVVGPLPVTAQRNKYIFTVQDALMKYVEAFPMEDPKAPTVARTFVKGIILRHGTPRQVLTDLGMNFTSKMMEEMCKFNI